MKNLMESFAILLVGVLSLLIIYLIVQYNMIEDDNFIEDIAYATTVKKKETTQDYLSDMEKYSDVDVKVDPKKSDSTNNVAVRSELSRDDLKDTVDDKSKSTYTKNLESYSDAKPKVVKIKPSDAPELKEQTIDDEIGMAIDAALDDL